MFRWTVVAVAAGGCTYSPPGQQVADGATDTPVLEDGPPDTTDTPSTGRITANLIGLWTFDENGGVEIGDSSGLAPIDLTIANLSNVVWTPGSLEITGPVIVNSGFARNRLLEACAASDAVTFEVWVTPANITQTGTVLGQPARIASFTPANGGNHHISLGQDVASWEGAARTTNVAVDVHGSPPLTSPIIGGTTHLVMEASSSGRKLYVNGTAIPDALGGPIDWDPMRTLSLSGEPNGKNPWLGTYHLMAMYDRALSDAEVMQNFVAGP